MTRNNTASRLYLGKYEGIIALRMNHCSFYCKQSLSKSHLLIIYLSLPGSWIRSCVVRSRGTGSGLARIMRRVTGKMCHARYEGYRSRHTMHSVLRHCHESRDKLPLSFYHFYNFYSVVNARESFCRPTKCVVWMFVCS